MAIAAPVLNWNAPAEEYERSNLPDVHVQVEEIRPYEISTSFFSDCIRRSLVDNSFRIENNVSWAFLAGYFLADGLITYSDSGQFMFCDKSPFKGSSVEQVLVAQLTIHSHIRTVGRLGFVDIAIRLEELWEATEDDPTYESINTISLKNAVDALTIKKWLQRPAIVVERDGTVAVKWSNDDMSLLIAFLPDGRSWYKFKDEQERIVETRRAHDVLSFARTILAGF